MSGHCRDYLCPIGTIMVTTGTLSHKRDVYLVTRQDDTDLVADLFALYGDDLGQEEIAKKVGVSQQTISSWLRKLKDGERITVRGKEVRRRIAEQVVAGRGKGAVAGGKEAEALDMIRGILAMSRQPDDEWAEFVAVWRAMKLPGDDAEESE